MAQCLFSSKKLLAGGKKIASAWYGGKQVWSVETILWQGRQQIINPDQDTISFQLSKNTDQLKNGLRLVFSPTVTSVSSGNEKLFVDGGLCIPKEVASGGWADIGLSGGITLNTGYNQYSASTPFGLYLTSNFTGGPVFVTKITEY